jgi:type IV pilus assembly protein PilC
MAQDIEEGSTLEQAYQQQEQVLPSLYKALVKAGTASGDLPAVLDQISRHARDRAHIASRLRRALFYPMVSAVGVLLVAAVMLGYLIATSGSLTSFLEVFSLDPLFGSSRRVFWWRLAPWIGMAALLVIVLGAFVYAWRRNPLDAGTGPRRIGFRLPLLGALRTYAAKSGFAATMAMLIGRGLPLPECLRLAAVASDDAEVAAQIEVMRCQAEGGGNLAASVAAGGLISPGMLWFVEAGEAGGEPAKALADVADLYRQRLDRAVDRLCFLVPPVGTLLIGLPVLGFAVSFLGPMYEFYGNLMGG